MTPRANILVYLFLFLLVPLCSAQSVDEFLKEGREARDSNTREVIYTRALKKHPSSAKLYHERGVAHGVMEHHDRAVADFSKAIEMDPGYAMAYKNRCLAYHRLKKYPESAADCARYAGMEPGDAHGHYMLGVNYTNMKKLPEAERALDKAEELDPSYKDNGTVRQMRYIIKKEKRKNPGLFKEKAPAPLPEDAPAAVPADASKPAPAAEAAATAKAFKKEPSKVKTKVLLNKARSRMRRDKYDEAIALYDEALALEPDVPAIRASRAYAEYEAGKKEEGLAALAVILKEYPACAKVYIYKAMISAESGDADKAEAELARAAELDEDIKRDFEYNTAKRAARKARRRSR
ncbi:MAG: tetratricopeptide repeat protein [Elusimicrobiales bacterium]|nr:tetratricopeptide repeat protein [Elusimicrobiales bacterium]